MLNRLKSFLGIPHPWSVDDLTKSEKLMYFGSNPTEYSDERLFAIVKSEKGWSTDDKVQAYKHLVDRGKLPAIDKQPGWKACSDWSVPLDPRVALVMKFIEENQDNPDVTRVRPKPQLQPDSMYMWQKLDFSGDLYSQHIRGPCRSTSRKLSDLPVMPAAAPDLDEATRAARAAAAAAAEAELDEELRAMVACGEHEQQQPQVMAAPAAPAPAAAAAAVDQATEQADHAAHEDQEPLPQPELMAAAAGEAAAPYLVDDSRAMPEQLRKSSKSSLSMTQQQQLRAHSKTMDQHVQLPGVAS